MNFVFLRGVSARMRVTCKLLQSASPTVVRNLSSAGLPHLPVPPLQQTLIKYLRSVRPFLSTEQYTASEKLIKDFGSPGKDGEKLQALLQKRAEQEENWLSEWWLNTAYLEYRDPVVVFSSPGLVFPRQQFSTQKEQLRYAAKLVRAAIAYKEVIDSGKIATEMLGKDPLDMSQYNKVFGTCRIPNPKKDKLVYNPSSKHIVVMHNNCVYKLELWTYSSETVSEEDIYTALKKVVSMSEKPGVPVGILTSDTRDNWAEAYSLLIKDGSNVQSLKAIESSLFVLCLDKAFTGDSYNDQSATAMETIHGCGSESNGGNRWFDKTVQFIVNRDGRVGLTYEHSPAEGQPIAVMMDFIVEYINSHKGPGGNAKQKACSPKSLPFVISNDVQAAIKKASLNLDKLVDNLEVSAFTFDKYGKEFVKSQKLSPDSFIQMAIQYAFYRIHKVPGAHYESASTRKYIHGRTETIRSCSVESIDFARTMLNPAASNLQKVVSLKAAISAHKDYTIQALNGMGVDRHLLGLKLIAAANGFKIPELYSDPSFKLSTHMRISTSQVASKCDGFMVYGPLVEDGYACCYNPRPNDINFGTSAFRSCSETSAKHFCSALENSLMDMHNILISTPTAKL